MSQNTIKILRVSTVEVLREFSESDGKVETTPFFHAFYSDGDLEFEVSHALLYDAASASCGSNELRHAAAVLLFNPARFGYVSSFAGHMRQRAHAEARGVDVELVERIRGRKDTADERLQYDEWADERYEALKTTDGALALINYTRNQYVLLDNERSQSGCAALFYLCAVGERGKARYPMLGLWAFDNIGISTVPSNADAMEQILFVGGENQL